MKEPTMTELLTPWTQTQQELWERWRSAMSEGASAAIPGIAIEHLPLSFWKAAIFSGLEMQLTTMEIWKSWFCATDANVPELSAGACQTLSFAEGWTRTQMQLWQSWFAAMESLMPSVAIAPARAAHREPRAASHRHSTAGGDKGHNGTTA